MRDGRKKGACVSLLSTHRAQRRLNCPQRHPLYAQTHPNKHWHVSRSLSLLLFFPTIPHAQSIFFSKQQFVVFVFYYNITQRKRRGRGEESSVVQRAKREECMWMWEKYTTLLHWLFLFYYRGEAGAPTITASSQVWRGDECVFWEERTGEGKENGGGK